MAGLGGWGSGGGGGGGGVTPGGKAGFTYKPAGNYIWGGGSGGGSTAAPPPATAPAPRAPTPAPQAPSPSRGQSASSGGATPYGGAGESAETLQDFGTGLLDPESELGKRWMEQLRENIGGATDAAQRAAGYQAAQSGFGGGSSPEVLEMQNELGVAGREAEGTAASDFLLKAPTLGVGALGTALGGQTQMRGQDLNARLQEMGLTQSGEQSNAQLEMQQRNLDLERDRMEQDRYLRELMLEYGGY